MKAVGSLFMSCHLVIDHPPAGNHRCPASPHLVPIVAVVAVVAVLASSPAAAVRIVDATIDGDDAWRENRSRCDDDDDIVVEATVDDAAVEALEVQYVLVADTRCPADGVGGTPLGAPSRHAPVDGEVALRATFPRDDLLGAGACGEDPEVGRRFEGVLCLVVRDDADGGVLATSAVDVAFDTAVPLPPIVGELAGDDDTLTVTIEPDPDEEQTLRVEHRRCTGEVAVADDGENVDGDESDESVCGARGNFLVEEGPAPSLAIGGLAPRSTWEVRLRVVDDFDNVSAPTEVMVVTLQDALGVVDLLEPTGASSCASAPSAPTWLVAALWPLWRRRRRARAAGGLVVGVALLATATATPAWSAPPARADGRWTGSLAVGLHHPDIDASSRFPVWSCLYGDASLVPVSGDVDVHLYDGFGSLQLTVGVEGAQARGFAQPASSSSGGCGRPGKVPLQFAMLGGRAGLTWRLDQLLDDAEIPIVPYARVGGVALGYMLTKRNVVESRNASSGLDGAGLRLGVEVAGGLMVALDLIDRAAAKRARSYSGLAHSFIFVEAAAQEMGLQGLPLDLTPVDRTFQTGLPLSFRVGLAVELL